MDSAGWGDIHELARLWKRVDCGIAFLLSVRDRMEPTAGNQQHPDGKRMNEAAEKVLYAQVVSFRHEVVRINQRHTLLGRRPLPNERCRGSSRQFVRCKFAVPCNVKTESTAAAVQDEQHDRTIGILKGD